MTYPIRHQSRRSASRRPAPRRHRPGIAVLAAATVLALVACDTNPPAGNSDKPITLEVSTKVDGNAVTVSWKPPAAASPVESYIIRVLDSNGKPVEFKDANNNPVLSVRVAKDNLPEGEFVYTLKTQAAGSYSIQVSAVDKDNKEHHTKTKTAAPPGAPALTVTAAIALGSPPSVTATLNWTSPAPGKKADDSPAAITGYTLYWAEGARADKTSPNSRRIAEPSATPATSTEITDLKLNQAYAFVVIASNDAGAESVPGAASLSPVASRAVPPGAPALADIGIAAMTVEGSDSRAKLSVSLSWTAPTSAGKKPDGITSAAIAKYTVYWKEDGSVAEQSRDISPRQTGGSVPTATSVGNLDPTRIYVFAVVASNDAGTDGLRSSARSTPRLSGENKITEFMFRSADNPGRGLTRDVVASINHEGGTIAAELSTTADRNGLKPAIVLSPHASVSPAGAAQADFRNPVAYTVRAQNGSTRRYTATVSTTSSTASSVVFAYKPDSKLTAHKDKFSLGDFDSDRLIAISNLDSYASATIKQKITVQGEKTSGAALRHAGVKRDLNVQSDGSAQFGISGMNYDAWSSLKDGSSVTITAELYRAGGTVLIASKSFTVRKTAKGAIHTWRDLQNMKHDTAGNYTLKNDVDFPNKGREGFLNYEPVGKTANAPFTGSLDGAGKTIRNLYVDNKENGSGLFGYVRAQSQSTTAVKDLTLYNVLVYGVQDVGTIAGKLLAGIIRNVHAVRGPDTVADYRDPCGFSSSACIIVQGSHNIGGLVGENWGTLYGTASGGAAVSGTKSGIGGLVGWTIGQGDREGVTVGIASVKVKAGEGAASIGGLVGASLGGKVVGIASGSVLGDDNSAFGLLGGGSGTGYWDIAATGKARSKAGVGISAIANVKRSGSGGSLIFTDEGDTPDDKSDDRQVFNDPKFLQYFDLPEESGKWPTLKKQ